MSSPADRRGNKRAGWGDEHAGWGDGHAGWGDGHAGWGDGHAADAGLPDTPEAAVECAGCADRGLKAVRPGLQLATCRLPPDQSAANS